jgi:hypothetical protein
MSEIKNDFKTFEGFVNEFPKYLELAKRVNQTPGALLKLFATVGNEVLTKSNDLLISEVSNGLQKLLKEKTFVLSDDSINALDNLVNFLKEKNKKD